jgi:hypothetical protein
MNPLEPRSGSIHIRRATSPCEYASRRFDRAKVAD